ncbi:hypothetical protein LAZ67_6000398 [Cordylochernes scorpioides]|uniref:Retrotransposon gag domain-containing protein n=1 Tax=Cordylochernes scorpioides TaxID=51811 RepID=A0ABY6KLN3_9ARAC|nr:hypothetical protein LAZ67_6000398 [Cordylochernes scorpioides]
MKYRLDKELEVWKEVTALNSTDEYVFLGSVEEWYKPRLSTATEPVALNPNIEIPKYDRTEDPRPWIESLEEIGFLYHWADYIIACYATMNMTGSAKTWLNLHKASFTSWENIKIRLIQNFSLDANKEELRMKLNRMQHWNEPAIRFAEDILMLCNKMDPAKLQLGATTFGPVSPSTGHIKRANGLEKMLRKIEGRRSPISWLEGIKKATRRSLDEFIPTSQSRRMSEMGNSLLNQMSTHRKQKNRLLEHDGALGDLEVLALPHTVDNTSEWNPIDWGKIPSKFAHRERIEEASTARKTLKMSKKASADSKRTCKSHRRKLRKSCPLPGDLIGIEPVALNPNIEIPKYDRIEEPRPWIESLEEIGFLYHWADYIIACYATMNMTGSAKTWLNLHIASFTSWENIKIRLIQDFSLDANKEELSLTECNTGMNQQSDRRINLSVLNGINPGIFLESQIAFGPVSPSTGHIKRANGLEKMLRKIEGRRSPISWLEGIKKATRRSLDELTIQANGIPLIGERSLANSLIENEASTARKTQNEQESISGLKDDLISRRVSMLGLFSPGVVGVGPVCPADILLCTNTTSLTGDDDLEDVKVLNLSIWEFVGLPSGLSEGEVPFDRTAGRDLHLGHHKPQVTHISTGICATFIHPQPINLALASLHQPGSTGESVILEVVEQRYREGQSARRRDKGWSQQDRRRDKEIEKANQQEGGTRGGANKTGGGARKVRRPISKE